MREFEMNILEEIQNCPVEWKELGNPEVAKLSRGKVMSKQFLEQNKGEFPVYSSQTANNGEIGRISSFEYDGEYITWTTDGANAGTVFYRQGKFSITNVCGLVDIQNEKLLTKFVYYYLTISTKKYVSSGMGNPKLMSNVMGKIKIPILPKKIQEKIVKILDKFTDYVTELTSELTLRQKQYSFYRDKLLSFEDEVYQVEWKTLGEVAKFNYGYTDKAQDIGDVRFIRITDIDENGYLKLSDKKYISLTEESQKYLVKNGDLLMARTGATYGKTLFINTEEPSAYASFLIKITPDEVLDSRYYWHFSKSELYWKQANNLVSKAGQPQFNANSLKNVKIPLPSLEIQSRIVQVLDNFDEVCNDLNIGLPKEIELRQKQYEYFRDKLLTFTAEGVYTDSTVQYRQDIIRLLQWVFGPIKVRLGSMTQYSTTKVSTDNLSHSTYIGVDNLLQNKAGKIDASNLPSQQKVNCYNKGDILVGNIRPYLKKIWFATYEGGASPDVLVIQNQVHECLENRFLYHILANDKFFEFDMQNSKGSKMPRGDKKANMEYQFILPSLFEQRSIYETLDKFDTLTTSISQGLPKEIQLRQKQYEYWRDKLLDFYE